VTAAHPGHTSLAAALRCLGFRIGGMAGGPGSEEPGLRIVSDPTFDAPGPHGYLTKTIGPAVSEEQLGQVDLVLVSPDRRPTRVEMGQAIRRGWSEAPIRWIGRATSRGGGDFVAGHDHRPGACWLSQSSNVVAAS
jgi:hypothetical protein